MIIEISKFQPTQFFKIEQDHSSDSTIENFPFDRREIGKAWKEEWEKNKMQTWERILEKYHILRRKKSIFFVKRKFCSTHFYDFFDANPF